MSKGALTRQELQYGDGDVDSGGDLGEVEQNLRQQLDHGVPHLQDTRGQGHHTLPGGP